MNITHFAGTPGDDPDPEHWFDGVVTYVHRSGWKLCARNARVDWAGGPSGLRWRVDVRIAAGTLTPAVARFSASAVDGRVRRLADLDPRTLARVEFEALANSCTFSRGSGEPFWTLAGTDGIDHRYYLRRVMDADDPTVDREAAPRVNSPDYRRVAEVYLQCVAAAQRRGVPFAAIEAHRAIVAQVSGCTSTDTARKWVSRAGSLGWLTDDLKRGRHRGQVRGPGELLREAWDVEGRPDWCGRG